LVEGDGGDVEITATDASGGGESVGKSGSKGTFAQVPSNIGYTPNGQVAPDGTRGEFTYQMRDQRTNAINQAGVTAHEDITGQVLTVYNLSTGQQIGQPTPFPDLHVDYDEKTNGQGQFKDSPIGVLPDGPTGLINLRNYLGVDIKTVLIRSNAAYSVKINNVTYPLGTFSQTIVQTATKIGTNVVCGNAGVTQSKQ